jgi:hypothetical protein
MILAVTYLETCTDGVDRVGGEELADRITQIAASYMAMIEHGSGCEQWTRWKELADKKASNEPPDPWNPPELAAMPGK